MAHQPLQSVGNKAFMELWQALKDEGVAMGEAAKAAAQVYERCGHLGYIPAK